MPTHINNIEFLVFPGLLQSDKDLFAEFLKRVDIVDISSMDSWLIKTIIDLRQRYGLRIPDAIIAATANQRRGKRRMKNTDRVMTDTFWIGIYPGLTTEMQDCMIEKIRDFVWA